MVHITELIKKHRKLQVHGESSIIPNKTIKDAWGNILQFKSWLFAYVCFVIYIYIYEPLKSTQTRKYPPEFIGFPKDIPHNPSLA